MSNQPPSKGGIGAFDFFCIGFGAIVGVGWAVSINKWMANCGGPLPASLGYIIALVMMVPVALCYCELAPMMPVAGGGMAYSYRAFNQTISFISGWAAFGAFVTIIPWEAIYVCDILSILFPVLKSGDPLYSIAGSDIYLGSIILGTIFSFALFYINYKGASASAGLQRVLTIILLGAGVLAMVASLIHFDANNFKPIYENVGRGSHSSFLGGAFAILASAPFFLAGFETIPQAIEDASGDVTSVGKTVVLSVGLACIFYAGLLFCLGGAFPWQQFFSDLKTPAAGNLFKEIYAGAPGVALYTIILVGAVCGLLTTWNGFMMASPRLMMSMARAYMLPQWLAKEHPKYGTPVNAMICCLVLSIAGPFLGMGLIDPLTSFSAAGFVLSWFLTSASCIRLRQKEPDAHRPYKLPGGIAMAGFACLMMFAVLVLLFVPGNPVFMGGMAIKLFFAWMALGVVLFLACSGERKAVSEEKRKASLFAKIGG